MSLSLNVLSPLVSGPQIARMLFLLSAAVSGGFLAGYLVRRRADHDTSRALSISDQRLRLLVESVTEYGLAMLDTEGRVLSWNEGAERLTGYSQDEIVGRLVSTFIPDGDDLQLANILRKAAEGQMQFEAERVRKDGARFSAIISMTPIRNEGGELEGFAVVTHDISDRVRLERDRQQLLDVVIAKATEWSSTFDAVNVPIVIVDGEGRIRRLNRTAKLLARLPFQDLIGRPVREIGGEPWQIIARMASQSFEHGAVDSARATAGEAVWDLTSSIFEAVPGERLAVVVAYDLTNESRLESALRESEVAAALGAMVAGVAHEVRNPLFTISATLDAWQARYSAAEGMSRYSGTLREQVDRLKRLMLDLLEYGRPHSLSLTSTSLPEVIAAAAADCGLLAAEHSVEVVVVTEGDMRPLKVDSDRMEQVFQNLIDNAIRHSPAGASVRVHTVGNAAGVTVRVIDEGEGATAEEVANAFVPFFSRRRGGTGLGLPIAKRIVSAHGGEITLEKRPEGRGVMASVTLKYDRLAAAPDAEPATSLAQRC